MASSNLSPPTRTLPEYTIPPSEITPTSVVPPPMSTTIEPVASEIGTSAPIAAAIGSSMRYTFDAPAPSADSRMARRSTCVDPQGTQMMMRGLGENNRESSTFLMNCLSICSVTVKSAITPSFIGLIAVMLPGVRPAFLANRHHRGLVEHDALTADIDERICGAEVDRQIAGEIAFEKFEHEDFRAKPSMPTRPLMTGEYDTLSN